MFKSTSSLFSLCLLCIGLFGSITFAQAQGCSQPSNLNSSVLAGGTVELSWSAIGGATSYVVQYRVGATGTWTAGGTVTTPNRVLTGLLPETVYTWRVRANCSTFSSVATFNSGGGVGGNTACSQPSNLDAFVDSPTSATLSWSPIEGALFYTVQYRAGTIGPWTNAGSLSATELSVGGLLESVEYQWRVKASCSVYSSIATFNTGAGGNGGNTECSQPSNQEAIALSETSVQLSWSAIQEAFNYTVQYRVGLSGPWVVVGPVTGTTLTLNGLATNTTYYWQVKASCSVFSSEAIFTTGGTGTGGGGGSTSCSAPSNTNTNVVMPTSAQVSWEPESGALNYTVQYRSIFGGSYITVGTVTTASATITGLQAGREYVWRVKANCSPYGSDVQFSTPFSMKSGNVNRVAGVATTDLQVWPNPAAEVVEIRVPATGGQLFILNSTGQVVSHETVTDLQSSINVANLTNGLYFVRLQYDNGQSQTTKLTVAR
jgi:Secretion system C-terminal sorting domain/Fibronectin type III domain